MRRSFYDFCLNQAAIERAHPHLFDLKFFLTQGVPTKNSASKIPENVVWGIRAPQNQIGFLLKQKTFMGFRYVLSEHSYPTHLIADDGLIKIVRPKIGHRPPIDERCWLEVTPEIVKSAYQSRNNLVWLRQLVKQFSINRIVFSSVQENPPSMRDMTAALAVILEAPFNKVAEIIKNNSASLVSELYEI